MDTDHIKTPFADPVTQSNVNRDINDLNNTRYAYCCGRLFSAKVIKKSTLNPTKS